MKPTTTKGLTMSKKSQPSVARSIADAVTTTVGVITIIPLLILDAIIPW
jgi:hypothetical protein